MDAGSVKVGVTADLQAAPKTIPGTPKFKDGSKVTANGMVGTIQRAVCNNTTRKFRYWVEDADGKAFRANEADITSA